MDDVLPRPTPDAQKELLDRLREGAGNSNDEYREDTMMEWRYISRF